MIKVTNLSKSYGGFYALDGLDLSVKKGSVYGLVGTNGSGKTTLIKHLAGVLRQDSGQVIIDGAPVYENSALKGRMGYIPDDLYFFGSYNLRESARFYRALYPNWNQKRCQHLAECFSLNEKRKINRLSKGMQKQAAFVLTMACMPDFLILDEPIDGLDPIVRKLVWSCIMEDVAQRETTVLISSHNLREMEGVCDSIGILNHGKMVIERDLDELKTDIHKVQAAFSHTAKNPYEGLDVLHRETRGSVDLLIIRNRREVVERILRERRPILFDILPLTLEEIFIYELGGASNEIPSIIF